MRCRGVVDREGWCRRLSGGLKALLKARQYVWLLRLRNARCLVSWPRSFHVREVPPSVSHRLAVCLKAQGHTAGESRPKVVALA